MLNRGWIVLLSVFEVLMYSISQLNNEIRAVVDARIQCKEVIQPDWITQEIINHHPAIDGDDSDFYFCVGRETIRDQVRKQINRFKLTPEKASLASRQQVLPGYEYLQEFYLLESGGEQIAIPLVRMSTRQRKSKIKELRAMGDGCHLHADELERYDEEHPNTEAA